VLKIINNPGGRPSSVDLKGPKPEIRRIAIIHFMGIMKFCRPKLIRGSISILTL
jgi:hypothetical protein